MANKKQIEEAINFIDAKVKEQITVSTVVKTLTSDTYGTYTRALIQCQDANIRFWVTGDAPSSSSGHILYNGDCLELHGSIELGNFKAIRDNGTDAVLAVSYFK